MIKVVYSSHFLKSAKKLSSQNQEKLAKSLVYFQKNPFYPLLHTKHLAGKLSGLLSFRITRDWRVIFKFAESNTAQLIEIASRKDIYK